jgi:protein gp37
MGDKSAIEWTEATWNPVVGCSKVSPGCAHCYAEELHRTRLDGRGAYPAFRDWTPANAEHNVTLVPKKLDQPLRWREPRMVFVNSMSDLFHELVPDEYIQQIFDVMAEARQHTFQVLTKRPERMRDFRLAWHARHPECGPLPSVWLGTSIENRRFVGRADALRETPAAMRFISAEPLLGPLVPHTSYSEAGYGAMWWDRGRLVNLDERGLSLDGIDWLIVGGESGPRHRPMDPRWACDLRDACLAQCEPCAAGWTDAPCEHRTAFFFKQWGGRTPKAGGRLLDGREWNEMPAAAGAREGRLHV